VSNVNKNRDFRLDHALGDLRELRGNINMVVRKGNGSAGTGYEFFIRSFFVVSPSANSADNVQES
jgi:hypothetical protein